VSAPEVVHLTSSASESNRLAWSKSLSFSSPESDFVLASEAVHLTSSATYQPAWLESLAFASPESDFVSAPEMAHLVTAASSRSSNNNNNSTTIQEHILNTCPAAGHLNE